MVESDPPSPTVAQCATAIRKTMEEIKNLRAERQVKDALSMRNGPNVNAIHNLPLNSLVLVWREKKIGKDGGWKGPYKLIAMNGETCTLEKPGYTEFRSTSVKPYYKRSTGEDETTPILNKPEPELTPVLAKTVLPEQALQPLPEGLSHEDTIEVDVPDFAAFLQEELDPNLYTASRQLEVKGLIEKGVFKVADETKIPSGTRIFKTRFVDEIKNEGTDRAYEKSRLVIQAFNDKGKETILTQSPTIQRVSQRLIICIAAMYPNSKIKLVLRDIS